MKKNRTITQGDISLPDRSKVTNKGDCGKLLIVGGDVGMAGAPSFSAEAAYRSGTGLVEILCHKENRIPLQLLIPEAILSFWGEWDYRKINSYSAIVVGVGMGKSDTARALLSRLLNSSSPTVVDADAINIIADTPELLDTLGNNTVLTPHLMEFSRLTSESVDEIKKDTVSMAKAFAEKHKTNLVLKDKNTVVALSNGDVYVNETGNSTLSKGGTGDILAGLIGSFLAQGQSVAQSVLSAVFLHGKAGERAGERFGEHGALARDIILEIPNVINEA